MSRIAVVTGAGTGIGRGIALALARRGIGVVLAGRRLEPLAAVATELKQMRPTLPIAALPADLADWRERQRLVEQVQRQLGSVSILVNNAAVLAGGELPALSAEEIERAVSINLAAPIDLTRLLRDDLAATQGAVVFIASNTHFMPIPSASIYTATKSAMSNLAASLRYELRSIGVHVLVAYPPDSDTSMLAGFRLSGAWRGIRLASPEHVGELVVAALEQHRDEVRFGFRERLIVALYRAMPWLVHGVLQWQRGQFGHVSPAADEHPHDGAK